MQPIKDLAETVRANRQPVTEDNPWLAAERMASSWITACWQAYGEIRDTVTETTFLMTYGSPLLQALVGLGPQEPVLRHVERDLTREAAVERVKAQLEHRFTVGHLPEAVLRALVYIRKAEGVIDERGFTALKMIRAAQPVPKRMSLARFKEVLREQFLLVYLDEERAIQTLPALIGDDPVLRKSGIEVLHEVLAATGTESDEGRRRLARIEALFDVKPKPKKLETAEATHG
jgi:hypothetical protein